MWVYWSFWAFLVTRSFYSINCTFTAVLLLVSSDDIYPYITTTFDLFAMQARFNPFNLARFVNQQRSKESVTLFSFVCSTLMPISSVSASKFDALGGGSNKLYASHHRISAIVVIVVFIASVFLLSAGCSIFHSSTQVKIASIKAYDCIRTSTPRNMVCQSVPSVGIA